MTPALKAQEAVVAAWKSKLDAANVSLDAQKAKLDKLQGVADKAAASLQASNDKLDKFANAPIQGMKAMNDAIFDNDMAQKKLRLEMMKLGDDTGIDAARDKLSKFAGEMELLSGEQAGLRAGGAGSEIAGFYDEQISKLEQQQKTTRDTVGDYDKLTKSLDELGRKADQLDLEKSLKFDPLLKKIDETAHAVHELPFNEIMAGVKNSNVEIAKYSAEVDKANAAVQRQQVLVDAATKSRDAISARYDAENARLSKMKDAYDEVKAAISDANQALGDMTQSASQALSATEAAAQKVKDTKLSGPSGNFAPVGGPGMVSREGTDAQNAAGLEQMVKDQAQASADLLGKFDMFGGIRKKWDQLRAWLDTNVGPMWQAVVDSAKAIFSGIDFMAPFKGMSLDPIKKLWAGITGAFKTGVDVAKAIWRLFKDDFKSVWDTVMGAIKPALDKLAPAFAQFRQLMGPLVEAFGNIWKAVQPLAAILGGALLLAFKIVASITKETVGPAISLIVDILKGFMDILFNVVKFVLAIINGDWKAAWEAALGIVKTIFGTLFNIIKDAAQIVWGVIKGFVEGIVGFFVWLWNELVGNIISKMVNAIITWFTGIPGKVWEALKSIGSKIIGVVKAAWSAWVNMNAVMWPAIWNFFTSLPGKVWNAIKSIVEKLSSAARDAWDAFKAMANSKWDALKTWYIGLAVKLYTAVIGMRDKLKQVATEAWDAFKDKAKEKWDAIVAWVKLKAEEFVLGFSIIKDKLVQVGKDIMQGLTDGIEAGYKWVKDKVERVANLIPDSFKNVLDQHSPSKVMIDLGSQTMEGYGIGLDSQTDNLIGIMKDVGTAMADSVPDTILAPTLQAADVASATKVQDWDTATTDAADAYAAIDAAFKSNISIPVKDFFGAQIPAGWRSTTRLTFLAFTMMKQFFVDRFGVPVRVFFTVAMISYFSAMRVASDQMWLSIRQNWITNIRNPLATFFTTTMNSNWLAWSLMPVQCGVQLRRHSLIVWGIP